MAIQVRDDVRSMLAIAAALNSTMPPEDFMLTETFTHVRPGEDYHGVHTGLKGWLEMEMEDFWHYNPKESSQFDKEATLAFVSRLSDDELMSLLRAMGKAPGDDIFGEKWNVFVDALFAERFEDVTSMIERSASQSPNSLEQAITENPSV
jgi:hypothetical protein